MVLAVGLLAIPIGQALFSDLPFFEALNWTEVLIFVAVGFFIVFLVWRTFGPPPAYSKKFRDAPLALATIVSTRTTGREVNDQPELEFALDIATKDGTTLRGAAREVVPHDKLARLSVGARVPVRYLPTGEAAIVEQFDPQEVADAYYSSQVASGTMTAKQVEVARHGLAARAVVLAAEPTGEIENNLAVVELQLEVTRPDGTRFRAARCLPMTPEMLAPLSAGAVTEVRYLADDESFVAVNARVV